MKLKSMLFYLLLISFSLEYSSAQSLMDSLALYHPLQIGNKWQYKYFHFVRPAFTEKYIWERSVINDTLIGGIKYLIIQDKRLDNLTKWLARFDSTNGNYYENNRLMDSTVCTSGWYYWGPVISYNTNVFGVSTIGRHIRYENYLWGIGLYTASSSTVGNVTEDTLVYAKINGKEYGVITTVQEVNLYSPYNYSLFQNYPNPWNPSTTIHYQLPVSCYTTLKVYDALGNEVATLVNTTKEAGSYDVQLSTSNYNLSSGVYFYRLQAGVFSATKKLILLK